MCPTTACVSWLLIIAFFTHPNPVIHSCVIITQNGNVTIASSFSFFRLNLLSCQPSMLLIMPLAVSKTSVGSLPPHLYSCTLILTSSFGSISTYFISASPAPFRLLFLCQMFATFSTSFLLMFFFFCFPVIFTTLSYNKTLCIVQEPTQI